MVINIERNLGDKLSRQIFSVNIILVTKNDNENIYHIIFHSYFIKNRLKN